MDVQQTTAAGLREAEVNRTAPGSGTGNGSFAGLESAHGLLRERQIVDRESLRKFLSALLIEQMEKVDLPVIRWAYESACQNDYRSLVELDHFVSSLSMPTALCEAGIKVGQEQLRKFAPLKGHKFLGHYRNAVNAQQARGHHVIVYGIHLFLFSIPLREGLLSYAYQTINGFISAAARSIRISPEQQQAVLEEVCASLPQQVERSLALAREQAMAQTKASVVLV